MKAFVLGVQRRNGVSKKTGSAYDFSQVIAAVPFRPVATDTFRADGAGFELAEFELETSAFEQFRDLRYPAEMELTVENRPDRRGMKAVVTGVKPVARPSEVKTA